MALEVANAAIKHNAELALAERNHCVSLVAIGGKQEKILWNAQKTAKEAHAFGSEASSAKSTLHTKSIQWEIKKDAAEKKIANAEAERHMTRSRPWMG